MSTALVIAAHGSRRQLSNAEIVQLAQQLEQALPQFSAVCAGFLELSSPSISQAIEAVITQGAQQVLVLPYFLAAGTHVVNDVPQICAEVALLHPQCEIKVLTHLTQLPGFAQWLTQQLPLLK